MTPDNFDALHQISTTIIQLGNGGFIFALKIIALLLTAGFSILLVVIYFKVIDLFAGIGKPVETTSPTAQRRLYDQEWARIIHYIESLNDSEWKLAVIEGDKIVDDALKSLGFAGETMGERLMSDEARGLASLQDIWDAHKLRNYLVHDITVTISQPQALIAVKGFEKALKELQMLS